jgi:hypothetical protein
LANGEANAVNADVSAFSAVMLREGGASSKRKGSDPSLKPAITGSPAFAGDDRPSKSRR